MARKKQESMRASPKELFAVSGKVLEPLLRPRPLIYLDCNGALEVENCKGILCYDTQKIVLNMGMLCVRIEGDSLTMDLLRKDFIRIRGKIFAVHLCYERV